MSVCTPFGREREAVCCFSTSLHRRAWLSLCSPLAHCGPPSRKLFCLGRCGACSVPLLYPSPTVLLKHNEPDKTPNPAPCRSPPACNQRSARARPAFSPPLSHDCTSTVALCRLHKVSMLLTLPPLLDPQPWSKALVKHVYITPQVRAWLRPPAPRARAGRE